MLKKIVSLTVSLLTVVVAGGLLFFLSSAMAHCDEVTGLDLQEVSLEYKSFSSGGRDPLITQNGLEDRALDKEVDLNVNIDILKYLYWNNTVHSMTDRFTDGGAGQFRLVGWDYKLGVRIFDSLHVQYEHFSQHLLDTTYKHGDFPVQDSLGFILYIYGRPDRKGVF